MQIDESEQANAGGPQASDLRALAPDEAVSRLVHEYGDTVYRVGLAHCGNAHDAEDLVQETFLQAFKSWKKFEGRSKPSTWLYTIAARACFRRRRKRSGEPAHLASLSDLLPSGDPRVPDIPSKEDGPLDQHLRDEAKKAVEQGLAELPRHFRLPLVLKDIAELKVSEVARILGLKEATVKTRVHRGRLLLRRHLAAELPGREAPAPDHARSVCMDLLQSKQEALDRGVEMPVLERELCSRCSSLFATLDLGHEICHDLGRGEMSAELREILSRELSDSSH